MTIGTVVIAGRTYRVTGLRLTGGMFQVTGNRWL